MIRLHGKKRLPLVPPLTTHGTAAISGDTSAKPVDLSWPAGMSLMIAWPEVTGDFRGRAGGGGGATVDTGGGDATRGGTSRSSGDASPRSARRFV